MIITDVSSVKPGKSLVRFTVRDKLTGKILPRFKMDWKPNTATPLAKEVACRVLGGFLSEMPGPIFVPYTAAFIEWGQGNSNPAFDQNNPDIESPFTTPILTPLEAPQHTGTPGQVKFYSSIDDSSSSLIVPGSTSIQEVGLRTAPVQGFPKGILIARFQNDSPLTISTSRIKISVEWIYIYI